MVSKKSSDASEKIQGSWWWLQVMKKAKAKIKKVIKGLSKASRTHAAQAKTLKSVLKNGKKKRS